MISDFLIIDRCPLAGVLLSFCTIFFERVCQLYSNSVAGTNSIRRIKKPSMSS